MEFVTEPEPNGTDRRRFLAGAGVGAAALAAALSIPGRALAQAADDAEEDAPEAGDYLAFAESVELAIADAQSTIAGRVGGPAAAQLNGFADHHRTHAAELARASGGKAKGAANAGMATVLADQIAEARDNERLLDIAIDLENTLAATHLSLSRLLEDAADVQLVATILPVESAHGTALGLLAGRTGTELFPDGGDADENNSFETQRKAIDPTVFPVEPAAEEDTTTTTTTEEQS